MFSYVLFCTFLFCAHLAYTHMAQTELNNSKRQHIVISQSLREMTINILYSFVKPKVEYYEL